PPLAWLVVTSRIAEVPREHRETLDQVDSAKPGRTQRMRISDAVEQTELAGRICRRNQIVDSYPGLHCRQGDGHRLRLCIFSLPRWQHDVLILQCPRYRSGDVKHFVDDLRGQSLRLQLPPEGFT